MNYHYDTKEEAQRVALARDSFSARLLTNRQFEEAMALTHVIEREIRRSGSFKEKLSDYAHAFSRPRSQPFDTKKAEEILRDLYKVRTGETMYQTLKALDEREEKVGAQVREQAYEQAVEIGGLMERGVKMSFRRAAAHQSEMLALEHGVTDRFAYSMMAEEFRAAENMELADWGKELDQQFFQPQIEAEKAKREQERSAGREDQGRQVGSRGNGYARAESRGPELGR